jgi:hypothetical protein
MSDLDRELPNGGNEQSQPAIALVVEALGRLRFGDIRLTVHEGRLVQVDVTERTRFSQS